MSIICTVIGFALLMISLIFNGVAACFHTEKDQENRNMSIAIAAVSLAGFLVLIHLAMSMTNGTYLILYGGPMFGLRT